MSATQITVYITCPDVQLQNSRPRGLYVAASTGTPVNRPETAYPVSQQDRHAHGIWHRPVCSTTAPFWHPLLIGCIACFGVPDDITSDRGPAFTSQLWVALVQLMGTTVHHTTAYIPAANDMAKRTHRTLKAALMTRCTGPDWKAQLPWVLLDMRTTPKQRLKISPAEMAFGKTIAVLGEFFPSNPEADDITAADNLADLRRVVRKYRPVVQTHNDNSLARIPQTLRTCTHVFGRNDAHRPSLPRPYHDPYVIHESRHERPHRLGVRRTDWVSIDRLKPAYLEDDEPALLVMTCSGRVVRPPS